MMFNELLPALSVDHHGKKGRSNSKSKKTKTFTNTNKKKKFVYGKY